MSKETVCGRGMQWQGHMVAETYSGRDMPWHRHAVEEACSVKCVQWQVFSSLPQTKKQRVLESPLLTCLPARLPHPKGATISPNSPTIWAANAQKKKKIKPCRPFQSQTHNGLWCLSCGQTMAYAVKAVVWVGTVKSGCFFRILNTQGIQS